MTSPQLTVAVEQIATTQDPNKKPRTRPERVRKGAATGAPFVVLPEASLVRFGTAPAAHAQTIEGPWATAVRGLASELGVIVLVGTFQPAADGRVKDTILVNLPTCSLASNPSHLRWTESP